jgi:integrase
MDALMATIPTQPSLQQHHGHYSWTSYWRDDDGKMHTKRFGKQGDLSAQQARRSYQFWMDTQWNAKDHVRNPRGSAATYTASKLAAEYLWYAHKVFRKGGKQTSHMWQVKYAMRALRDFLGTTPAEAIESPAIASIRDAMIKGGERTRSLKTVNGRLLIIKQAFAWAREKGRVTRAVALDVASVKPLTRGRSDATDPKRIAPIALDVVWATCDHASPTVKAMVEVCYYTGARPGEVCQMRGCDLETVSDDCWVYTPESHKMQHKGKFKRIVLGPKAIEAVKRYLSTDTRAYLFNPAKALMELRGHKHESLRIAKRYSEEAFRKAIHHACRAAGIGLWAPNQLRHAHATEVRRVFGLAGVEDAGLAAARDSLGHDDKRTTAIYADESLERAMAIARKVG